MEDDRHPGLGETVGQRIDFAIGGEHVEDRAIGEIVLERFEGVRSVRVGAVELVPEVLHGFGQVERYDELVLDDENPGPFLRLRDCHDEWSPKACDMAPSTKSKRVLLFPQGLRAGRTSSRNLPYRRPRAALPASASRRAGCGPGSGRAGRRSGR